MREVDSILRSAVEKVTGKDYGKMDTEKLQEKAGEELDSAYDKIKTELSTVRMNLTNEERTHKDDVRILNEQIKNTETLVNTTLETKSKELEELGNELEVLKKKIEESEEELTWDYIWSIIIKKLKNE